LRILQSELLLLLLLLLVVVVVVIVVDVVVVVVSIFLPESSSTRFYLQQNSSERRLSDVIHYLALSGTLKATYTEIKHVILNNLRPFTYLCLEETK
jgi:hypothetical protein